MAAKKPVAKKPSSPKKKPVVLLFRLQDISAARPAFAALELPPSHVVAPAYVLEEKHNKADTMFDTIAEPTVPKADADRTFELIDAVIDLFVGADDSPLDAAELHRAFHMGATMEQAHASLTGDGFRVVTAEELRAKATEPRSKSASLSLITRCVRALGARAGAEAERLVKWLEEGGPKPSAPSGLVTLLAAIVLDEALETYGELEDRLFALAAESRALPGLKTSKKDEGAAISRMGLLADKLRQAGYSEGEITYVWLDGFVEERSWPSATWFAMGMLPELPSLVHRILDRPDADPAPALARLLVTPVEELPSELDPYYKAAVRKLLETDDSAARLGPELWNRILLSDPKGYAKAAKKHNTGPLRSAPAIVRPSARLADIDAAYKITFPEEILEIWELASSLSPDDPTVAFAEIDDLGLVLVGPFDLLAKRSVKPGLDIRLHFRFRNDPPELFTALSGNVDGLHFGYWWDDTALGPACVASTYAHDSPEMDVPGRTLWEAIRWHIESTWDGVLDNLEDDRKYFDTYARTLFDLARLRERVTACATRDRPEVGSAYTAKYTLRGLRPRLTFGATPDRMGVWAEADQYRSVRLTPPQRTKAFASKSTRARLVKATLDLAKNGRPAAALELGRCLWPTSATEQAFELLDAAYGGLERPGLREILHLHHTHRDMRSVDVLIDE